MVDNDNGKDRALDLLSHLQIQLSRAEKKKETKTKFVTVILTNTARIEKLITVKTEILIFWYTYIAREKCMLMVTISDNGVLVIKM